MCTHVADCSPSQEAPATIDNDSVVPTSPDDSVSMNANDKEIHLQRPDDDSEVQVFPLADQRSRTAGCVLVEKVELVHHSRRKGQTKSGRFLKKMQKRMKSNQEKSRSFAKESRPPKKTTNTRKKIKIVKCKVEGKEKQQHPEEDVSL